MRCTQIVGQFSRNGFSLKKELRVWEVSNQIFHTKIFDSNKYQRESSSHHPINMLDSLPMAILCGLDMTLMLWHPRVPDLALVFKMFSGPLMNHLALTSLQCALFHSFVADVSRGSVISGATYGIFSIMTCIYFQYSCKWCEENLIHPFPHDFSRFLVAYNAIQWNRASWIFISQTLFERTLSGEPRITGMRWACGLGRLSVTYWTIYIGNAVLYLK